MRWESGRSIAGTGAVSGGVFDQAESHHPSSCRRYAAARAAVTWLAEAPRAKAADVTRAGEVHGRTVSESGGTYKSGVAFPKFYFRGLIL